MHVNARECVLNVLVEDPLEALGLRVLVGRAPHLVGERGDRLGGDGAVGRALGRESRSLSTTHGLEVGHRDTSASDEELELGQEVLAVALVLFRLVHDFSPFHLVGEVGVVVRGDPESSLLRLLVHRDKEASTWPSMVSAPRVAAFLAVLGGDPVVGESAKSGLGDLGGVELVGRRILLVLELERGESNLVLRGLAVNLLLLLFLERLDALLPDLVDHLRLATVYLALLLFLEEQENSKWSPSLRRKRRTATPVVRLSTTTTTSIKKPTMKQKKG